MKGFFASVPKQKSSKNEPRWATCIQVVEYRRIARLVTMDAYHCDCPKAKIRGYRMLHIDREEDTWWCEVCGIGGSAWALAEHLLSAYGPPRRMSIIWLLKTAARCR